MLFQTPTQFIVLGLMLVVGFLFGLASHPGGRKWRQRYDDERAAHGITRDETGAERKSIERELATSERRVRDLEAEVAKLRAAPVAAVEARTAAVPADLPAATPAADPAPARHGWLGRSTGDDLARIRGVDRSGAERLKEVGITRFADLEALDATQEAELEEKLGAPAGYIARRQWREQAALLREGKDDEFTRRFGDA